MIPGFRGRLEEYKVLDVQRKLSTARRRELNGIAQGVLRGHAIDDQRVRRSTQFSCPTVPGLGRNLSSVKQAARNGVVSIFHMNKDLRRTNSRFHFKRCGPMSTLSRWISPAAATGRS